MRRVAVHHALQVRPLAVDLQVQQCLAGSLLVSGDLLAGAVDRGNILGREKTLGVHRRRAEELVVTDLDGNIPVVGRHEPLVVDPPADLAHFLLELVHVIHQLSLLSVKN